MVFQLFPSSSRKRGQSENRGSGWMSSVGAQRRASEQRVSMPQQRDSRENSSSSGLQIVGCAPGGANSQAPSLDTIPQPNSTPSEPKRVSIDRHRTSSYSSRETSNAQRSSPADPLLLLLPLRALCPDAAPAVASSFSSGVAASAASDPTLGTGPALRNPLPGAVRALASPRRAPPIQHLLQHLPQSQPQPQLQVTAYSPMVAAAVPPGAPVVPATASSSVCPILPPVLLPRGVTGSVSGLSRDDSNSDCDGTPGSYLTAQGSGTSSLSSAPEGGGGLAPLEPTRQTSQGDLGARPVGVARRASGGSRGDHHPAHTLHPQPSHPLQNHLPLQQQNLRHQHSQHPPRLCAGPSRLADLLPALPCLNTGPSGPSHSPAASGDPLLAPAWRKGHTGAGPAAAPKGCELRPLVVPFRLPSLVSSSSAPAPPAPALPQPPVLPPAPAPPCHVAAAPAPPASRGVVVFEASAAPACRTSQTSADALPAPMVAAVGGVGGLVAAGGSGAAAGGHQVTSRAGSWVSFRVRPLGEVDTCTAAAAAAAAARAAVGAVA